MTTMTGKEALMQILRSEGVEYIFGLPGSTELQFLDALEDHPELKYVLGLHECVATGIAEGYSRASGKAGILNLHTLPGLGSAMPMLINAREGGIPLVVTAGQQDSRFLMQEPGLSGDLVGLGRQFAKWSGEVSYAHDLPIAMRRAFKVAMQPPTGPVFISLPQNVLIQDIDLEYLPNNPLSLSRRCPDRTTVERAAELLVNAETPAIILGNGVAKHEAVPEVVKFAELIGTPVYQMGMSAVNFPTTHPQHLGELAFGGLNLKQVLQSVDVLIAIGTKLFMAPSPPSDPLIPATTKLIQIDNNPWEMAKNFPVAAGIDGDIKLSLAELNDALQKKITPENRRKVSTRVKEVARKKEEMTEAFRKNVQSEWDNVPISASRLMGELASSIRPGTVVVDDSWSCSATLRRCIDFTEPNSYHRVSGPSIGWGMPAAIGIKLALPDRTVVAVVGDGGAMFSFQSLWTAASYNVPVTFIICANASYRFVKQMKIRQMGEQVRGRFLGLDFAAPKIDFCQLAQAMGVWGQKVERPEELGRVLRSTVGSGKPAVVEVAVEVIP